MILYCTNSYPSGPPPNIAKWQGTRRIPCGELSSRLRLSPPLSPFVRGFLFLSSFCLQVRVLSLPGGCLATWSLVRVVGRLAGGAISFPGLGHFLSQQRGGYARRRVGMEITFEVKSVPISCTSERS